MAEFALPAALLPVPAVAVDARRVEAANEAARHLWGDDVVGRPLTELFLDDEAVVRRLLRRFLRSPSPVPGAFRVVVDDETQVVPVLGCRLIGPTPRAGVRFEIEGRGWFAALTRTLDRMNVEAQRRREIEGELQTLLTTTVADLESTNAALRRFTSGVAHDLRSPLGAVAAFAELVHAHPELPEDLREVSDRIVRVAHRSADLVQDLLREALAAAGQDEPTTVHLDEVAEGVRTLLGDRLDGVELTTGTLTPVLGRPAALRQVVLNLVSNALLHGDARRVHLDAAREGDRVHVRVSDDGRGIPPAERERVLEEGVRLSETVGTGLGLAHCRRIVDGLGGAMWIDDDGAHPGATVHLLLPAAPSASTAP